MDKTIENAHILSRSFFDRDPRRVARALLGKLLVRREETGELVAGRIVEAEVYLGRNDAAAHAAAGRTARNAVLFGPPGHAYVYFIYGNHYCMNVSCLPAGQAGCVLLRALEPVLGAERMTEHRGLTGKPSRLLTSGPGRLCQALAISRTRDNGKDLVDAASDLTVMDDGFRVKKTATTARIGITKAADLPLRFVITGNAFVSKRA